MIGVAIRLYRLTLLLYPATHREAWGDVMICTFEDMCQHTLKRSGSLGLIHLWLRTLVDTFATATQERFSHRRGNIMETITQIDTYKIEATVREIDQTTLYRVQDKNGKIVALKLYDQPEDRAIKHVEPAYLKRIDHPGAPRLLSDGKYDGKTYYVMEWIDGSDWLAQFEGETIDPATVIDGAIQVCEFLDYLHSQPTPLVNRSIKPANIMTGDDGQIRLLDYELMVEYDETQNYPLIGTEGYSPPEQYVGHSDARSDIYSLGASLYHVLTGRDPRKGAPFMFHFRPPRSVNPAISEALEAVILKAVEHKPKDRFQSAAEMKAALIALR